MSEKMTNFAPDMDTGRILAYLGDIAANNSREWFHEHREEYDAVRRDFEDGVQRMICRIAQDDPSVAHITVKDATYRFYRDTRFSPDKSPYKRHFGAYIAAHGKKSLHGGYYIHLEPGHCLVCVGTYWLPTNILTATRNEILSNSEQWKAAVENREFRSLFGLPGEGDWDGSERGFGLTMLKTCPAGFPKDSELLPYLRMKDYCCWVRVDDDFFAKPDFTDRAAEIMMTGRAMNDFINAVVDDYE